MKYTRNLTRWDIFEAVLEGPKEGNPFVDQSVNGIFTGTDESIAVKGFYDGNGIYRIRFMPSFEGRYTFIIRTSFDQHILTGAFIVSAPEDNSHGPVRATNTYHFAYADKTVFNCLGTTSYVWHLQEKTRRMMTLEALTEAGFNKLRFCIFPKHYLYNLKDPDIFPYEGTPMDAAVLNEDNYTDYTGKPEGNDFDYTRFNPEYFRRIESDIYELSRRNIEADLIIMHPYDRWGFSCMSHEEDELYLNYIINRFSAFRNVWWSLANEYDLMPRKTFEDWERYGNILLKNDPYHHLCSIHNCHAMYDYSRPWITHCSVQRTDLYKTAELTDEIRAAYGKPVVMDEIAYEGNIAYGWGNITGQEMVRRFWETVLRGGYPGHGETIPDEENLLWWSHGGKLLGESWRRINFLKKIMDETPGCGLTYVPLEWDSVCAVTEDDKPAPVKNLYLFYYSFMCPSYRTFHIDDETYFTAEIIDTWNMTVTSAGTYRGKFTVDLPGQPYMAIRLTKTKPEGTEVNDEETGRMTDGEDVENDIGTIDQLLKEAQTEEAFGKADDLDAFLKQPEPGSDEGLPDTFDLASLAEDVGSIDPENTIPMKRIEATNKDA